MERQKGDRGLLNTKANLILALFCGRDKITAQITKTFPIIKKNCFNANVRSNVHTQRR